MVREASMTVEEIDAQLKALRTSLGDPTSQLRYPDGSAVYNRTGQELLVQIAALEQMRRDVTGEARRTVAPIQVFRVRAIR
jgi:hypothetical protein